MPCFSFRKRLEKAEAEYVAAKLDLHKKTEVKEQLTEHLCAIIQQNELRKARKLEELMLQLVNAVQESQGVQGEGCGQGENPAHHAAVNETKVNDDGQVQTESAEAVARTSEGQEREPCAVPASAEA